MKIAIIGAGISGLSAARCLAEAGHSVELFDKARGPGGRLASRRRVEGTTIDHGTWGFDAHDEDFRAALHGWEQQGWVAQWPARYVDAINNSEGHEHVKWVGVPRMSALTRALSSDFQVHTDALVTSLNAVDGKWTIGCQQGLNPHRSGGEDGEKAPHNQEWGPYDQVVVAIPAPSSQAIGWFCTKLGRAGWSSRCTSPVGSDDRMAGGPS